MHSRVGANSGMGTVVPAQKCSPFYYNPLRLRCFQEVTGTVHWLGPDHFCQLSRICGPESDQANHFVKGSAQHILIPNCIFLLFVQGSGTNITYKCIYLSCFMQYLTHIVFLYLLDDPSCREAGWKKCRGPYSNSGKLK